MTHPPTPSNPLPPTMRIAVELGFVRSCPECRAAAERAAVAAINDPSVTGFRAVPGAKHAHEVVEGRASFAPPDTSPGLFFDPTPHSDTNGFDPPGRPQTPTQ